MKHQYIVFLIFSLFAYQSLHATYADRLEAYCQFLDQYERPFTLLELRPGETAYSFDIAERYDCTCVIVERGRIHKLLDHCLQHEPDNIALISKHLDLKKIQRLGECEHFDVTIVGDIKERFGDTWLDALQTLTTLGDHILLDVNKDHDEIRAAVESLGGVPYTTIQDQSTTYLMYHEAPMRNYLPRKVWKSRTKPGFYKIRSSFTEKKLVHKLRSHHPSDWIKGITLFTFRTLKGVYPTNWTILENIKQNGYNHNDLWMGNMVIQGKKVRFIDCKDKRRNANSEAKWRHYLKVFTKPTVIN